MSNKYEVEVAEIGATVRMLLSPSEVGEYLQQAAATGWAAFDYETSCLSWKKGHIVGVSFCADPKLAVYIPIAHPDLNAEPAAIALAYDFIRDIPLVAHNWNFEYGWTRHHIGCAPRTLTDTQLIIWILNSDNCKNASGLKEFVFAQYKYRMQTFDDVTGRSKDFTRVPAVKGFFYGASDSLWTYRIKADLEPKIFEDSGLATIYRIENALLPVVCEMIYDGIRVDIEKLDELRERQKEEVARVTDDLVQCINVSAPGMRTQLDLFGNEQATVNLNSDSDMLRILRSCGLNIDRTDKMTLHKVRHQHEVVDKLLTYRKATKIFSTYVEPYYELMEGDGIIHPGILQGGAPTGRMAGARPNLMAIPKLRD